MPGTPPSKSWVNREWRDYVLELAEDLKSLQQYSQLFQYGVKDTMGGSSGGANSRVFPAVILSSTPDVGDEGGYVFAELRRPWGSGSFGEILPMRATNTYEWGIYCGSNGVNIPPAVGPNSHAACFGRFDCEMHPIAEDGAVIVTMNAKVWEGTTEDQLPPNFTYQDRLLSSYDENQKTIVDPVYYWFSAVVQPCFTCESNSEPLLPGPDPEPPTIPINYTPSGGGVPGAGY